MNDKRPSEIAAMKAALDRFEWTTLHTLRSLIDELDIRASRLRGASPEWDREFRKTWLALEEVYAVMVDRKMSVPDANFQETVSIALNTLRQLVNVNGAIK